MFKGGAEVPTSREMLRAVRRLKKKDVVGEGGYGVVYKMVLKDRNFTFAVKKLKQCLEAARGFENELETLGEIKHCNLVKLRGYCVAPLSRLLIYDFVPNGTLDQLLHRMLHYSSTFNFDNIFSSFFLFFSFPFCDLLV
jgi:interleukin-1 receptor-associated kinase 1